MRKLSCVIFDLDGTLAETNDLIFASFNHVCEKYLGTHFSPEQITALFGPPEEVAIERLVGQDRAVQATDDFFQFYLSHFKAMAKLHAGMLEILKFLKEKKIFLAVFTGKGSRSTDMTLEGLGIRDFFDLVITGDNVSRHKPSGEGIQKILEHFQLSPDRAMMIGDAVSDIKAAHEVGLPIAAVVWDSYGKEKVMGMQTDYLFHSVEELRDFLEKSLG